MAKKILLIDDDALLRRSLSFNLEQAGYKTHTAANAEDGIKIAVTQHPDLILLDINLPGMDGLDALKQLRGEHKTPVIMLTARRRELDEVLGLELGADDYVTKPFDINVLLAHIKAVLRRTEGVLGTQTQSRTINLAGLTIDPIAHTATINQTPLELSPREFELLYVLASNPNQVLTTDDLINQVWGVEFIGQPQVVYVHIRWLREKIEKDPQKPQRIITIRGVGYKFQAEV